MEIVQVKQYLAEKKSYYSPDTEEHRIASNRLSELEYHEGMNTLGAQQKVSEIVTLVAREAEEAERVAQQEQKIAEVDEMKLPYDFDTDFELPGLNDIIRDIIKQDRAKSFQDFDAEYGRLITEYTDKLKGAEDREVQLSRQNGELQQRYEDLKEMYDSSSVDYALFKENHEEIVRRLSETNLRMAEVEQNRKNAADQLEEAQNEILRLEDQLEEMRRADSIGERKAQQIIDVTPITNDLYEKVKQAAAAKRQAIVTGQIGANFKTVEYQDGSTDVIHVSQIGNEVEAVDSFQYPEAPETVTDERSGVHDSIQESDMGDRGCADQVESVSDAEVSEQLPSIGAESTETAPQAQDSEEVGKELAQASKPQEYVTRTEFEELKKAVDVLYVRQNALEQELAA